MTSCRSAAIGEQRQALRGRRSSMIAVVLPAAAARASSASGAARPAGGLEEVRSCASSLPGSGAALGARSRRRRARPGVGAADSHRCHRAHQAVRETGRHSGADGSVVTGVPAKGSLRITKRAGLQARSYRFRGRLRGTPHTRADGRQAAWLHRWAPGPPRH